MMQPETALLIGMFAGGIFGYALGFFMARGIYRRAEWPKGTS